MTIIENIAVRQNPVKVAQRILHNFLPFANTHAEYKFIENDSSQHEETAYLLRSAENKRKLLESIAQVDSGQGTITELIE